MLLTATPESHKMSIQYGLNSKAFYNNLTPFFSF